MVDIFTNLLCTGGFAYLGYRLRQQSNRFSEAESAQVFTPSQALGELNRPEVQARLPRSRFNPSEYRLKAFIEGTIESDHPFQSKLERNKNLVYSRNFKTILYSNESVLDTANSTQDKEERSYRFAKFGIRDPETKDSCPVNSCYSSEITGVSHHAFNIHYKELNTWEKFLVQIGKIYEFLGLHRALRGITIGWTEHEIGISVGSILTAYGELIYNVADKSIRFESPLNLIPDKATLLRDIQDEIGKIYTKGIWLFIPFGISLIYLIKRLQKYYAAKQKEKMLASQVKNIPIANFEDIDDEYKCVVCCDRPRDVIMKPCLHFSLCAECYKLIQNDKCPICKEHIDSIAPVIFF